MVGHYIKRRDLILVIIVVLCSSLLGLWSYFYSHYEVNMITNDSEIVKIDMIVVKNFSLPSKEIIIQNKEDLDKIKQLIKNSDEINIVRGPITVRDSGKVIQIDIDIYKKDGNKINITIGNTIFYGWLIEIGSLKYKNDSIADLLKKYY